MDGRRFSISSTGSSGSGVGIQVGSRVIAGATGSAAGSGSSSSSGTSRLMGGETGVVRFIGDTHFAQGEWVGIELDQPEGKVSFISFASCLTTVERRVRGRPAVLQLRPELWHLRQAGTFLSVLSPVTPAGAGPH